MDFADVKTIMQDKGSALMGIGIATGESRAGEAAKKLFHLHYWKHQSMVHTVF